MTALAVPERRLGNVLPLIKVFSCLPKLAVPAVIPPKQKTGDSVRFPLLSQQIIYPYTDLLLHDIGAALDDGVKEKNA